MAVCGTASVYCIKKKVCSPPSMRSDKVRVWSFRGYNESCTAFISALAVVSPVWTCGRDLFLSNQQALNFPCRYSNKTSLHAALFLITVVSLGDNNPRSRAASFKPSISLHPSALADWTKWRKRVNPRQVGV